MRILGGPLAIYQSDLAEFIHPSTCAYLPLFAFDTLRFLESRLKPSKLLSVRLGSLKTFLE